MPPFAPPPRATVASDPPKRIDVRALRSGDENVRGDGGRSERRRSLRIVKGAFAVVGRLAQPSPTAVRGGQRTGIARLPSPGRRCRAAARR